MYKFSILRDLVDIIYPNACMGCRQPLVSGESILCTACLLEIPKTNYHRIPENEVMRIFIGRCRLERAAAFLYFAKGGIVQALMHELKYRGRKEAGTFLGRMAGIELRESDFVQDVDCVVPVPLHPKKLKKRSYNQSEVFADAFCETADIPLIADNLIRVTHSATQTKKSRFARWQNVESIFEINDPSTFKNKHVLLVDDVVTTGSTLEACTTKLIAAGALVSVLTIAVAK